MPAIYFGYRDSNWFLADFLALLLPLATWFSLTLLRVGGQSLSHMVEMFALVILMPLLVSLRVFLQSHLPLQPQPAALTVLGIGVVAAVLLRLLTPNLPE